MKQKRNYVAFSVYCCPEDYEVIRKLQDIHSINISNSVRVFLKHKLEQLDKLEKDNKNNEN